MNPTLVLLAAGMSTRYGRLKQLEPVGPDGETLLDYAVFDGMRAGFSRVVLIIREELEDAFREHVGGRWPAGLEILYHHQRMDDLTGVDPDLAGLDKLSTLVETRRKPWGTAHALLTARDRLPGPFVILNADDFYGAEAFVQAVEFLEGGPGIEDTAAPGARGSAPPLYLELLGSSPEVPRPSFTFGLVTYTLRDTLSDHGGVSRGVCEVDDEGWLSGIRETLEIREAEKEEDRLEGRTVEGDAVSLTGEEPISTNFWIFDPSVFPLLATGFNRFLKSALEKGEETQPEFLIPTVVNQALRARSVRVKATPTAGRFLGITHPQDRPWVVEGLEEMTGKGRYPRPLWG